MRRWLAGQAYYPVTEHVSRVGHHALRNLYAGFTHENRVWILSSCSLQLIVYSRNYRCVTRNGLVRKFLQPESWQCCWLHVTIIVEWINLPTRTAKD